MKDPLSYRRRRHSKVEMIEAYTLLEDISNPRAFQVICPFSFSSRRLKYTLQSNCRARHTCCKYVLEALCLINSNTVNVADIIMWDL